jgi:D-inositol-3-phosphate glycosyltransferase
VTAVEERVSAATEVPRARDEGRRLRIAMFCHNYVPHPGGLEVMVQALSRGLAGRHEVTLVTSAWEGAVGVSREEGMTVHRLPAIHASEPRGVPWPVPTGAGLRAALAAVSNADVVHAHGALYAQTMLAARAARRAGAPLVLTDHVGFVEYRSGLLNAVQRAAWAIVGDRTVRRAAAITTYNDRVQAWLESRYRRPVRYIGNGVDVDRFRPLSPAERRAARQALGLPLDGTLVLFVGRASEKKNVDAVLAMPRDGFTLVTCGAKRDLRLPGVIDLGVLPHARMPELFGACDLMVNPSTGEGFPLAIQEAIAAGLPLAILWDAGYDRWLARDTVAACRTLDDIAPTVRALVVAPAERARLSAAEREWAVTKWSWAATVAAYEDLYRECLGVSR